jgi:hypothetical protein
MVKKKFKRVYIVVKALIIGIYIREKYVILRPDFLTNNNQVFVNNFKII